MPVGGCPRCDRRDRPARRSGRCGSARQSFASASPIVLRQWSLSARNRAVVASGSDARVAEELHRRSIVRGEQWLGEHRHGVVAEVGGDVSDAQSPAGGAIQREVRRRPAPGAARGGDPSLVFGEDCLLRDVGPVVQREQQIAMTDGIVGSQRQRPAVARLRLRVAALRLQRHPEIGQPPVLVRRQRDGVRTLLPPLWGSRSRHDIAPRLPCAAAYAGSIASASCNAAALRRCVPVRSARRQGLYASRHWRVRIALRGGMPPAPRSGALVAGVTFQSVPGFGIVRAKPDCGARNTSAASACRTWSSRRLPRL